MKEFLLFVIGIVLTIISVVSGQNFDSFDSPFAQDDTLIDKAVGREVVLATVNKIQTSLIFPDDFDLLKRIALIESNFGEANNTFRPDYFGGIWQISEAQYNQTVQVNSTALTKLHEAIYDKFRVDWPNSRFQDLLKPFFSGLAVRLYFSTLTTAIPQTLASQANYWKQYYTQSDVTAAEFVQNVTAWEENELCKGNMDLLVVLDESGSIASADFTASLGFVADLFDSFSLDSVRQGMMTFSSTPKIVIPIENSFTAAQIRQKVLTIRQDNGGTATNEAISQAISVFGGIVTPRPGVPKVMLLFTDGQSAGGVSNAALAKAANITSFAIGIGAGANQAELQEIAYGDKTHVFTLEDFSALTEFFNRLNSETCDLPQKPGLNETIEEEIEEKEKRIYYFDVPPTGLNVFLYVTEGSVESYYSLSYSDPSAALHDGIVLSHNELNYIYPHGDRTVWIAVIGQEKKNSYTLVAMSSLYLATTEAGPPSTTPLWGQEGPCFDIGPGFFPDKERCNVYYECTYNQAGDLWTKTHVCPGRTVWCQDSLRCESELVCPCDL